MTNLPQCGPAPLEEIQPLYPPGYEAVEIRETDDGALYLCDRRASASGWTIYSGLEHLEAGSGLSLLLTAAMGLIDEDTSTLERVVSETAFDAGVLIAGIELAGHPTDRLIMVFPFRCGNAGRRLLGLPTREEPS